MMTGKNNRMKALSVSAALLLASAGTTSGFQLRQHQSFGLTAGARSSVGSERPGWTTSTTTTTTTATSSSTSSSTTAAARKTDSFLSASNAVSEDEDRVLDTEAIAKYAGAIATQMLLITGVLTGIDRLLAATNVQIPFLANCAFFFVFALKSRIFNPMSNQRPQRDTKEAASVSSEPARKMPEWTPPGITFPIVWILVIGPLRAASTALLVSGSAGAAYASPAVLALMLHLSIGDTWNTVNNIERRYGTSVVGVACVWISAAVAAYSYGQVDALAGKLLSLPLIWLTIASSLIVRTWQINPSEVTGEKESLLPTKPASQEGSITKLVWFEGED